MPALADCGKVRELTERRAREGQTMGGVTRRGAESEKMAGEGRDGL